MSARRSFDLLGPLPRGRTVIEASAGTGKTYTISALIVRYLAGELAPHPEGAQLRDAITIDQVLVVTFTRAAASELRDRIRSKLLTAVAVLDGAPQPDSEAWLSSLVDGGPMVRAERSRRLRDALTRFDEATVTTIHGFCQQALAQAGVRGMTDPSATLVESTDDIICEVTRDLLLRELADDAMAMSPDSNGRPVEYRDGRPARVEANRQPRDVRKVENDVVAAVRAAFTNAGAVVVPDPSIGGMAGRWARVVNEAVEVIGERQRQRRQIGYDRLISDLRDALDDPVSGAALADQLATRFPLVLVDEFQDTDLAQWAIFQQAFSSSDLVTVGDPKQAIYRFRGADVHAYLAAVLGTDPASVTSLAVNHRSDGPLLDALALLFDGVTLGHDDIAFTPVLAREGAGRSALIDTRKGMPKALAPLQVRVVPDHPNLPRTKGFGRSSETYLESGATQRVVLDDVASRIHELLEHGQLVASDGTRRPVLPGDIAVLVPSQRRASDTAATLRGRGIPSVRARTGSVLDTDAALQWRVLLAALAAPTYARAARAAGMGWFFGLDPDDLVDDAPSGVDGETPISRLQQRLAQLADRLRTRGVADLYDHVRVEAADGTAGVGTASNAVGAGTAVRVLGQAGGDRDLADLDHVTDLLVAATRGASTEPLHVAKCLDRLIADAAAGSEATMRRIETDADAVQVTTIHASKGLEFPIVLMPFAYVERPSGSRPYVYNVDGVRHLDVASWVSWHETAEEGSKPGTDAAGWRKREANVEVAGDSLRTLYVAMTRARHRLELWWAPTSRSGTAAFGRLLLDREAAGPVQNAPFDGGWEKAKVAIPRMRPQLDALAAASGGTIAVVDVPLSSTEIQTLDLDSAQRPELALADGSTRAPLEQPEWRTWSFTAITNAVDGGHHGSLPVPALGGLDEANPVEPAELVEPLATERLLLTGVPGGATFGTMVHGVFEHVDPTSPTLADDLVAAVEAESRRAGVVVDAPLVAAGLHDAIRAPLGALFGGRSLAEISPGDRLAELTFDFALRPAHAAAIGTTLAATLHSEDPFRPYADDLARALRPVNLDGWLTGSIDAVFRVDGRFVVADYKTNRLPSYHPDHLVGAMAASHYPLQALLYGVALHRYLALRLGAGYDPTVHLGGIAYLFVRGMSPSALGDPGRPNGVCSWQPPVGTIVALDHVLGDTR